MLHVGASKIEDDFAFASAARNTPTSRIKSESKVAAKEVAHYTHS